VIGWALHAITDTVRRLVAPVPAAPCARHSGDIVTPYCGDCGWPWHDHSPASRTGDAS